jgi:hypothetical protein
MPMKKLKLEIDALAVDSFATGDGAGPAGTVDGHEMASQQYTCNRITPYCKTILTYCPCTPRWDDL